MKLSERIAGLQENVVTSNITKSLLESEIESTHNKKELKESITPDFTAEPIEFIEDTEAEEILDSKESIINALIKEEDDAIASYESKAELIKGFVTENEAKNADLLLNHIKADEEEHRAELAKFLETGEIPEELLNPEVVEEGVLDVISTIGDVAAGVGDVAAGVGDAVAGVTDTVSDIANQNTK